LSVKGQPFVAAFEITVWSKARHTVEQPLRGKMFRNSRGYTRTEFCTGADRGEICPVVIVWNPETLIMWLLEPLERRLRKDRHLGRSVSDIPKQEEWSYVGVSEKKTEDVKVIHGLKCIRVLLSEPVGRTGSGQQTSESWISFDWNLVLVDVIETDVEKCLWQIVELERHEPDPAVFEIPAGFTEKE
jgi:hypothetical protein